MLKYSWLGWLRGVACQDTLMLEKEKENGSGWESLAAKELQYGLAQLYSYA